MSKLRKAFDTTAQFIHLGRKQIDKTLSSDLPRYVRLSGEPLFVSPIDKLLLRRDFQAACVLTSAHTIQELSIYANTPAVLVTNIALGAIGYILYRKFLAPRIHHNFGNNNYGAAYPYRCFDTKPLKGITPATPMADIVKAKGMLKEMEQNKNVEDFPLHGMLPLTVIAAGSSLANAIFTGSARLPMDTSPGNYIFTVGLTAVVAYTAHRRFVRNNLQKVINGEWAIVPVTADENTKPRVGPPGLGMA